MYTDLKIIWYGAIIISSQLPVADWYGVFSNEMLAEACLDRLVHKSLERNIDIFATLTRVAEYHRNRWPTIARNKQY